MNRRMGVVVAMCLGVLLATLPVIAEIIAESVAFQAVNQRAVIQQQKRTSHEAASNSRESDTQARLIALLRQPLAKPVSLASGNLDQDSLQEIITGYAIPGGSLIGVQPVSLHAINTSSARKTNDSRADFMLEELSSSMIESIALPFRATSMALGNFTGDGVSIALLSDEGTMHIATAASLASGAFNAFHIVDGAQPLDAANAQLARARITSVTHDDLLLLDRTHRQVPVTTDVNNTPDAINDSVTVSEDSTNNPINALSNDTGLGDGLASIMLPGGTTTTQGGTVDEVIIVSGQRRWALAPGPNDVCGGCPSLHRGWRFQH